ncbi:hypothetical protein AVEN_174346-1 [Araneus ventricosus]|uniref:Uncharacterized protein n=1 Tax=Araneus ventricosus TaxID=182803 RepID=A0A4Y2JH29_ARAVE|nr:hypothetical protein AVEN_174346-1 [Araneus ventricosus]
MLSRSSSQTFSILSLSLSRSSSERRNNFTLPAPQACQTSCSVRLMRYRAGQGNGSQPHSNPHCGQRDPTTINLWRFQKTDQFPNGSPRKRSTGTNSSLCVIPFSVIN